MGQFELFAAFFYKMKRFHHWVHLLLREGKVNWELLQSTSLVDVIVLTSCPAGGC